MGRVEVNKQNKKTALYNTAFQLFIEKGFAKTTISDIVKAAGLAKGTFYLYFKDKYELRDQLIAKKTEQIWRQAEESLQKNPVVGFENHILALMDYILKYLNDNRVILKFISKNLSWGVFTHAIEKNATEETQEVYDQYLALMKREQVHCESPDLLLYTIVELVSSTCYSCILYERPVPMPQYLPFLHKSIHQIILGFTEEKRLPAGDDAENGEGKIR